MTLDIEDGSITAHGVPERFSRSELAANMISLGPGKPFAIKGRRWAMAMLDAPAHNKVWMTSRQIGKTSKGITEDVIDAGLRDLSVLYITPLHDQAVRASQDRLDPMVKATPLLRDRLGAVDNTYRKKFGESGTFDFRYASDDADRIRSITADKVHYDEAQDIDLESVHPVVRQVLFTSKHKLMLISGTPKGPHNQLQLAYNQTKQYEWILRCPGCRKHNMIGLRNIGLRGPVCYSCDHLLDVDDGRWEALNPEGKYPGFHVGQLHCIDSHNTPRDWAAILEQIEAPDASKTAVLNEVFGFSHGDEEFPLTREDFERCPKEQYEAFSRSLISSLGGGRKLVAGIDWGHGESDTTLVIGYLGPLGDFHVVFMESWGGERTDVSVCVPEIKSILKSWGVIHVHADFGGGHHANGLLRGWLGEKLTTNYWSHTAKAAHMAWSRKHGQSWMLTASKPIVMSDIIRLIKSGRFRMPKMHLLEPHIESLTGIIRQEDRYGNVLYTKARKDDMLQGLVYAWLAAHIIESKRPG